MYAVTAASGQLGRLVVAGLLDAGVNPSEIVAVVRTPARASDLADQGVVVRVGDYDDATSLPGAFAGVDTLLFISGPEAGRRVPQHRAVVEAAVAAGVSRVVYTSILRADTSAIALAAEHKATEEMLVSSGLTYTMLRNGWYTENYTAQLPQYLAQGAITSAAGDGRIAAATRADYAAAAVAVMTGKGHDNAVYELGGPAFTMADLARAVTAATGTTVTVHDVNASDYTQILKGAGLDDGTAAFVAGLDEAAARGDLDTQSDDLARLVARPLTPMIDVVRAAG